jgi:hypothetical protein
MGEKFRFVGSGISRKKLGHPALSSGTRLLSTIAAMC